MRCRKPRKQPMQTGQKVMACAIALLAVVLACSVMVARCDTAASAPQTTILPEQPWGLPWATINAASVPAYAAPAEEGTVVQRLGRGIAVEVKSLRGGWAEVLRWTSTDPLWVRVRYLDFAW